MRYMFLIYSREEPSITSEEMAQVAAKHASVLEESSRRGLLRAADPLAPSTTATTVRVEDGKVLVTDGPFAETKEQLAGYYILDCRDLDEAVEWAAKIPTSCQGAPGYVEIRPLRDIGKLSGINERTERDH
ncbi:MAG: YciI family protein [Bryobacteraceae bacterium]